MREIRKYLLTLFIIFIICSINAQVSNIKKTVKKDKITYTLTGTKSYHSSSRSSNYENNIAEGIAEEIFIGIIRGLGFITTKAQKAVLDNANEIPNVISLETGIDYGTNTSELTLNPSIRGNWGIIATDFRYSLLHDNTSSLQSLDWQVLVLRVPIKNLKLNYGIGFISLLNPKTSYFESSTGLELNLIESKLNFISNYRWTSHKSQKRYRQEVKLTGDYQVFENKLFHISPMAGFTYQKYFNTDRFLFFNIGVKLRLY